MKPSIGRIVHYVIPAGESKGEHRAAIITFAYHDGRVDLTVFVDSKYDCTLSETSTFGYLIRGYSVPPGNPDEPNTWHWPEREE